jgi:hypothetical protein
MRHEIHLNITGYPDSDAEDQAELAWGLQRDLLAHDVDNLSYPSADSPAGAKGDALEWAQLVVTVVGALPPLIEALRFWLGRHRGASITVEIDGDRLTLIEPSDAERQDLIAAWIWRHDR